MGKTEDRAKWKLAHNSSRVPYNDDGDDNVEAYGSLSAMTDGSAYDVDISFNKAVDEYLRANGVDTSGWYTKNHTFSTLFSKLNGHKDSLYGHNGDAKNITPINFGGARGFPTPIISVTKESVNNVKVTLTGGKYFLSGIGFEVPISHKLNFNVIFGYEIVKVTRGGAYFVKDPNTGAGNSGAIIDGLLTVPSGQDKGYPFIIDDFELMLKGSGDLDFTVRVWHDITLSQGGEAKATRPMYLQGGVYLGIAYQDINITGISVQDVSTPPTFTYKDYYRPNGGTSGLQDNGSGMWVFNPSPLSYSVGLKGSDGKYYIGGSLLTGGYYVSSTMANQVVFFESGVKTKQAVVFMDADSGEMHNCDGGILAINDLYNMMSNVNSTKWKACNNI